MGFGDVKLAGVVGGMTAYLSWGAFLTSAFGAFLLGAVVGLVLIAVGRAGRRTAVPFGPFMLVAAWASILGASGLGELYLAPGSACSSTSRLATDCLRVAVVTGPGDAPVLCTAANGIAKLEGHHLGLSADPRAHGCSLRISADKARAGWSRAVTAAGRAP